MTKRFHTLLAMAGACAALAGCFGGDDNTAAAPAPADPLAAVPAEATATAQGTVDYQVALAAASSETREPIDLTNVTLPTSDTTEPAAVN
jgi:hypothetical protein